MVYDWEDKQEACYRMYVAERRSLDEVMKFFREEVGFVPSKRAFQTQFRRWGFPSKQNPAHRNEALVARTRELWEKNTTQKVMISTLQAEGFNVTERELMRLRSKHRLLLRGANTVKSKPEDPSEVPDTEPTDDHHSLPTYTSAENPNEGQGQSSKRKQRLDELQKESDERWESKKRRRRTRGWAGLPADPPGPPRFASETTLESSKMCLGLDNSAYVDVRGMFQAICQEHNIVKKTIAGPERWQAAKNQLIQSHGQLSDAFNQADGPHMDQVRLSLDVICMDVTKRLRTLEHQMTLAEAKNMLNVNPEEGRRLRQALINILTNNNFVNKHESGNWEQLKQQWMEETGLAGRIPAQGNSEREQVLRAIQAICRDIMKRWRDAQVAQREGKLDKHATGSTSGRHDQQGTTRQGENGQYERGHEQQEVLAASSDMVGETAAADQIRLSGDYDFQIDPTLLMAARGQPYAGTGMATGFDVPLHETDSRPAGFFP